MDNLELEGDTLIQTLKKIALINRWLGGNQITIEGVQKLLKSIKKEEEITIIDLGCGDGSMLRALAKYGNTNNLNLKLIGIDANKTTISFAKQQSKEFDQISYLHQDIFSESFRNLKYDIVLSTLFLHHFDDKKIISLLKFLLKNVKIGIVINDLNRNKIAYYLFKLISFPLKNQMVKNDGLISILRGFKKEDLKYYSKEIGHQHTVNWKWAFRYQWIIQK